MWNKIYLVVLALAAASMCALTYLAYSQLQSAGFAPAKIAESYRVYEGYYQQFLWISSVVLLILANVLLWTTRKSWALWTTLLYFAAFLLLQYWWLGGIYSDYVRENRLPPDQSSLGVIFSAILCVIAAVGIFFNQFLVLRMRDKMHGVDKPSEAVLTEEKPIVDETSPS